MPGKVKIRLLENGAKARLHNKRITVVEREKYTIVNFKFVDKNPETPASWNTTHKGKIRETSVKMSHEAMEALVMAYLGFKRKQAFEKMKAKKEGTNEA